MHLLQNFMDVKLLFINFKRFFFLSGFSFTDTDNSQDSRRREGTIFYSTLPLPPAHEHSDIYLQLCTWDDYHILFHCTACIYQTTTRWDLPPYRTTIWLVDDAMLIFVCLLVDFILRFVTAIWHERNWWTRTRVEYHPCITTKPINRNDSIIIIWFLFLFQIYHVCIVKLNISALLLEVVWVKWAYKYQIFPTILNNNLSFN